MMLLEEAKALAKSGVKELILVAQDTTLFGVDHKDKKWSCPTFIRS